MSTLPPEDLTPTKRAQITFGPLGVARIFVTLFSGVGQRDPPSSQQTEHIRLITIGISHFCEKVRWGLDLLEQDSPIYYTEDAHPPPFASFHTVPASNNEASVTPMIVKSNGVVEYKSNVILHDLCGFLYPKEILEQVQDMEADLGQRLGATVRCLGYHTLLQKDYHKACCKCCNVSTSNVEAILFEKMLDKGIEQVMRKKLDINESTAAASEIAIRSVFVELSKRLETNGGEYLMDTTPQKPHGFTAADLTLAALAYPIIRPPEMVHFTVPDSELPPDLLEFFNEMRNTTAGQHVLKVYRKHRGVKEVHIKTTGRDRYPLKSIMYGIGVVGVAIGAVMLYRRK